MASCEKPKVGLLALTLELYETLAPALRADRDAWVRREILPALAPQADVIFEGAAFNRPQVEARFKAFEAAGAEAVIVMLLTYSPSQVSLPSLRRTSLPILIWNTQELWAVDGRFGDQEMTNNHGVHGTQDLANVLLRSGVKFQYVTSHLRDRNGLDEVSDFIAAAHAGGKLHIAKLGLMGYPFPGMGDFAVDTTDMVGRLGCTWTQISVDEYITRAASADPAAVRKLVQDYRQAYDVAADISDVDIEATARVELAMRGVVAEHGLSGLTYQFTAFGEDERTLTVPFVAASRMMADGIGFGGEGDLIGTAGTCLLNWLQPPASFSEIFTIDFGGNSLFMSHMGEANVFMSRTDRKVRMVARPGQITRTRHGQLGLVTNLRPGPATLFSLTLAGPGRWRIVYCVGDIPDYGPQGMSVPHFKFAPRMDVRDFLTRSSKAGGPHHNAICFGDASRRVGLLADILGIEAVEVK